MRQDKMKTFVMPHLGELMIETVQTKHQNQELMKKPEYQYKTNYKTNILRTPKNWGDISRVRIEYCDFDPQNDKIKSNGIAL